MSNLLHTLSQLQKLQTELEELLRQAQIDRGAWLIVRFTDEHPAAAALIKSVFTGTPAEVLDKAAAYWPGLRDVPNILKTIEKLQRKVLEEWEKPRGKRVDERKRLKA